jgi:hypothetical protein
MMLFRLQRTRRQIHDFRHEKQGFCVTAVRRTLFAMAELAPAIDLWRRLKRSCTSRDKKCCLSDKVIEQSGWNALALLTTLQLNQQSNCRVRR